ncbi:MBL fold metallo-hydrolase [Haladaptatus pallidirubidus]|uniref:MBL fold metallo-hydrolase n=1 Tax=Haladaptatus pallidirubidus TaxID=1008152 RepID=A0AAV3UIH9_9EURY|nr:MBL fold metallo-hydrolase [Haladaptatus pallidirubidus]
MERIGVGTGNPEGTNSSYVFPKREVVIDPGPPGDTPWQQLKDGLANVSLQPTDVSTIFVTHWHIDHAGLAPRLAKEANADIAMHKADAQLVAEYRDERERRLNRDMQSLEQWGVPEDIIQSVRNQDTPSPLPDQIPVRQLSDGDQFNGLEVIHTPGHTSGHASVTVDGQLFVGDAVLPTYTPNVGGSDTRTTQPLQTYYQTLERLRTREEIAYPGHGKNVSLGDRIDEIFAHHKKRSEQVLSLVQKRGPVTPWEIATILFGEMSGIHVKLGAGEAAAHLTALAEKGDIDLAAENPYSFS